MFNSGYNKVNRYLKKYQNHKFEFLNHLKINIEIICNTILFHYVLNLAQQFNSWFNNVKNILKIYQNQKIEFLNHLKIIIEITCNIRHYSLVRTVSTEICSMVTMDSWTASSSCGRIVSSSSCNLATSSAVDSSCTSQPHDDLTHQLSADFNINPVAPQIFDLDV